MQVLIVFLSLLATSTQVQHLRASISVGYCFARKYTNVFVTISHFHPCLTFVCNAQSHAQKCYTSIDTTFGTISYFCTSLSYACKPSVCLKMYKYYSPCQQLPPSSNISVQDSEHCPKMLCHADSVFLILFACQAYLKISDDMSSSQPLSADFLLAIAGQYHPNLTFACKRECRLLPCYEILY